ncbi:hypothetical protein NLG97_g7213 [Lecanicillium saksenae]|uniref:Uncharacterized protein n=1 Tax=Lecanicillium saksenae TaxID=468837 RepID=A0ACC1QPS5_9HYPO|nr:hypothetical protein NLG97_g7213 [Lecanicillium saksenae]
MQTKNLSTTLDVAQLEKSLAKVSDMQSGALESPEALGPTKSAHDASSWSTKTEDAVADGIKLEKAAYVKLIQDGGRPLYPIKMIGEVSESPQKYRKLLRPFWAHPGIQYRPDLGMDWEVFQRQWRQRQSYRNRQLDNRGIIEEPDFDAYVREHKEFLIRGYKGKGLDEIEDNPESLKGPGTQWELEQATRDRERQTNREPECETFVQYQQALKRRLLRHGYNNDVVFLEEPKAQNALTEWVEYLGFECWWKDEYIREYERRNDIYTRRWEYIRGQDWVGSDETPELLDSWEAYDQRQALRQQSQRDVDKARQAVDDAKNQLSGVDLECAKKSNVSSTLDAALRKLEQAEERYCDVDRRNQLIARLGSDRRGCQAAKQSIDSQSALLDWASQQIPLIKAEMSRAANGGRGTKNRKRLAEVDIDASAADASHKHRKSVSPAPDGNEENNHL